MGNKFVSDWFIDWFIIKPFVLIKSFDEETWIAKEKLLKDFRELHSFFVALLMHVLWLNSGLIFKWISDWATTSPLFLFEIFTVLTDLQRPCQTERADIVKVEKLIKNWPIPFSIAMEERNAQKRKWNFKCSVCHKVLKTKEWKGFHIFTSCFSIQMIPGRSMICRFHHNNNEFLIIWWAGHRTHGTW